MNRITSPIPENLLSLWKEQDNLLDWSQQVVSKDVCLQDHLELVEAYMSTVDSVRRCAPLGNRHFALCGLFMRTFDSLAQCARFALTGNYSGSAIYARDLLETLFLIDYLMEDIDRPEAWLASDNKTRREKFNPGVVRDALDKRDGYKEGKRLAHYKILSEMGAHPTPASFSLKKDGAQQLRTGPFRQVNLLEACLQEAAIMTSELARILLRYCRSEIADSAQITSRLSVLQQRTVEKYFP